MHINVLGLDHYLVLRFRSQQCVVYYLALMSGSCSSRLLLLLVNKCLNLALNLLLNFHMPVLILQRLKLIALDSEREV